jgi:hypothetical protein
MDENERHDELMRMMAYQAAVTHVAGLDVTLITGRQGRLEDILKQRISEAAAWFYQAGTGREWQFKSEFND